MDKRAIVLLSGGLDSATTLAIAKEQGFGIHAITFCYGQRHRYELEAAKRVARQLGARNHSVITIDLRVFGNSALTDDVGVPKGRGLAEISCGIPVTYVPARNTIFLSYALALAEVQETGDIFLGVNSVDYSGYPDCRPEYIAAFEDMANLATKAAVEGRQRVVLHTPLIKLTKAQIIQEGLARGVDYSLTSTCYDPSEFGEACGECDACQLRLKGFAENGVKDPIRYKKDVGVVV
jgi:7-cyano-7-deazaguanine synthase